MIKSLYHFKEVCIVNFFGTIGFLLFILCTPIWIICSIFIWKSSSKFVLSHLYNAFVCIGEK